MYVHIPSLVNYVILLFYIYFLTEIVMHYCCNWFDTAAISSIIKLVEYIVCAGKMINIFCVLKSVLNILQKSQI